MPIELAHDYVVIKGLDKFNNFSRQFPYFVSKLTTDVFNTSGARMYREINDRTPVRTGRLKRGNWLEITDTSLHYWNNVPYSYYVDHGTSRFEGRKYMTIPFEEFKPIILADFSAKMSVAIRTYFST